jgi:hypothetical protein
MSIYMPSLPAADDLVMESQSLKAAASKQSWEKSSFDYSSTYGLGM